MYAEHIAIIYNNISMSFLISAPAKKTSQPPRVACFAGRL
jgi:hypothetical protein